MISKNQLKLIRQLGQKKYRKQYSQYLVQGEKNVLELLNSPLKAKDVFATQSFIDSYQDKYQHVNLIAADEDVLTKASTLVSNNAAIAIVDMPTASAPQASGLILALDGVSDPGNLGTIIRVADWYGIKHIVTSTDSADAYNPKTISATMGSFVRVSVSQVELPAYLSGLNLPIYGAFLDGKSVHKTQFTGQGVLLMGSESHGIRQACAALVTDKITIPAFGGAESLNVAMATGIILDNFKRQA
ncbi:MAG: TrmH family RNA methyltransferase [Pseudoalteromonas rhizosphaerae]|jgi:TrmH family RNA methyltransferase|uniref:RNA methyltransferase n=1 Tax=Pseudoalteromonas neustonica TaxID=1840331 RepID=A0ABY3FAD4_9GAMM|nr:MULTISPECIES: RNA methyltransferase [Pseudoalteromonas]MBB1292953.1 RNA methyltransferase [Pseudoalteromonas sp. SR41-4]MBB1303372.1 RNA methyltransferase [Pseudoalteromonas sp. SR44-8]MBB1398866.1 RNA methyltransferase [Pseudoalteromonas sp. SG44-8]MBB1410322.1 RNA methyltransferase [Pseudoalteromonas sp. SG44-17]MBB1507342.1 RNA methyltransferase [Pseudoalteromonas sp. SG41-1]|tara:strand:- start:11512 stop:12243 length:732 start_codon:yes stop_codon:yes gene_type:complete